jgi:hypothetical protein
MQKKVRLCFLGVLICISCSLLAQKKDSLRLACPFERVSGREPKEAFSWSPPDHKIVMISYADSIVRSCVTGTVTNVVQGDDNEYEIVIFYKDYYFWYTGMIKPKVVKGQAVSARQPIGSYIPGTELEFRMYKNEDIMDPRNLLECKMQKAN